MVIPGSSSSSPFPAVIMAWPLGFYTSIACLLCAIPFAATENDATILPAQDLPDWTSDYPLQLTLTPSGDASPLQYTVIPLTPAVGLNESHTTLTTINIVGNIIAADASNYKQINSSQDVAYLSCDSNSGPMPPDEVLHKLMEVKPTPLRAILLYSLTNNWCSIEYSLDSLVYGSILTMVDGGEAGKALSFLNDTDSGEIVKASIYGIVTVLFASFIIVGSVRAHRHPERYGPRRGDDRRVRQSRARGIARAVLDTIPIVKFGNPTDPKPDPDVELDTTTTDGQDTLTQRTASNLSDGRRPEPVTSSSPVRSSPGSESQAQDRKNAGVSGPGPAEHPDCSICTEYFTIGEDVRLLPCNHQFHPACIDPWLVNVAGTCPLCRYNLNSHHGDGANGTHGAQQHTRDRRSTTSTRNESAAGEEPLPPPLGDDTEDSTTPHRNRLARLFDINRLRNAPVEERIAALRQLRAEEPSESSQSVEGEDRHQSARFAERLRDTFRIRTRAQSPQEGRQNKGYKKGTGFRKRQGYYRRYRLSAKADGNNRPGTSGRRKQLGLEFGRGAGFVEAATAFACKGKS